MIIEKCNGWGRAGLHLLFPPRCLCCAAPIPLTGESFLCMPCLLQVEFIGYPHCLRCGMGLSPSPGEADRYCRACLLSPPPFDTARSLVWYRGPVRTLLHKLKFNGDIRAAAPLAALLGGSPLRAATGACDLIVPVPLHRDRLQSRGLNQALVLARIWAGEHRRIAASALIRVAATPAQTGLSGAQRRKNLKGAFSVAPGAALAGKRICLIDDVFTTGTTVSACTAVLKQSGAAAVHVLTLARV